MYFCIMEETEKKTNIPEEENPLLKPLTTATIIEVLKEKDATDIEEGLSEIVFKVDGVTFAIDTEELPYMRMRLAYDAPKGRPEILREAVRETDDEGNYCRFRLSEDGETMAAILCTVESGRHHFSKSFGVYVNLLWNCILAFNRHYKEKVNLDMMPMRHSIPGTEKN